MGKAVETTIQYQNTGREPALGFVYLADSFLATADEDAKGSVGATLLSYMNTCKGTKEWTGGSVIYPSTGFSTYNLNLKSKDDLVDDSVTKGDKLIVVQGCFLYRSFDVARHSYFCYFYKQGQSKIQNLNICASGQYAD